MIEDTHATGWRTPFPDAMSLFADDRVCGEPNPYANLANRSAQRESEREAQHSTAQGCKSAVPFMFDADALPLRDR